MSLDYSTLDLLRQSHPARRLSRSLNPATNDLSALLMLWGEEDKQTRRDLLRLTAAESALYDALRDNRIRKNLRLEQERIGFGWVIAAVSALTALE